jgi:hypothetical protein
LELHAPPFCTFETRERYDSSILDHNLSAVLAHDLTREAEAGAAAPLRREQRLENPL